MDDQLDNFVFFFPCGGGGNFVKLIFAYYLIRQSHRASTVKLAVDPITGHCHNNLIAHTHWIDQLPRGKKIIAIDFDQDDRPTLARMVFAKFFAESIERNPAQLKSNWQGQLAHIDHTDTTAIEQFFITHPDLLVPLDWQTQIETVNPALVIRFKDIVCGDLNQIVVDFLRCETCPQVQQFIERWRTINARYLQHRH